jgi:uncharacterized protein
MRAAEWTETSDGHRLQLDLHLPAGDGERMAILLHGIFGERSGRGRLDALGDELAAAGMAAVRFDFRGHGASSWPTTSFSPLAALRDLRAAIAWCDRRSARISFVGVSFGGATLLNYLDRHPAFQPDRVVLWSPVLDYRATFIEPTLAWGKELFTPARVDQLRATRHAPLTPDFEAGCGLYDEMQTLQPHVALATIAAPTLILHGDSDDKVPVEVARRLAKRCPAHVRYRELRGVGHGFTGATQDRVLRETVTWLIPAA